MQRYDIGKPLISIETSYLKELYDEIEYFKKELAMRDDEMAELLEMLASSRMKSRPRPPVYREGRES